MLWDSCPEGSRSRSGSDMYHTWEDPIADERETVPALGEFGLIAALSGWLPADARTLVGIGDDAAVLAAPDGRVVASTDFLLEGRSFPREVVQPGRGRPQGRGPEPDRRRGHGRGAHRAARRAGRAGRPAG